MKMNLKLRLQNKITLTAIVFQVIFIVYSLAALFGVELPVPQAEVKALAETVIGLMVLVGVCVDPTTSGLNDSDLAMTYLEPRQTN